MDGGLRGGRDSRDSRDGGLLRRLRGAAATVEGYGG